MALSRVLVVVGVVGFFLAILGGAGVIFLPRIFKSLLDKKLPLVNNSDVFNLWQNIPLPIYRKFYFFNLTNPTDFVIHKEKPKLEEVGPYSYRVTWIKENITWNSNGTVSYREVKTYVFDRNASVGTEKDIITSINIPLVSAGALLNKVKNPLERRIVAFFINRLHEQLVVQHTVSELLFDGYPDPLIKESRIIDPTIPDTNGKFGLMIKRNGSNDGLFTVYTGKGEMDKYNLITRWNGLQNLTWWRGTCGMINGSNGELVPPLSPGQDSLYIFNPDFCRSFKMVSDGYVTKMGINLERFVAPRSTFQNGDNYSANACFDTKFQLRSGVMDLGPCQHGAPVALSFPHFYMADHYYLEQVEGLQPNSTLHRFQLDLEPKLGLTVSLRGRIQLNTVIKQNKLITNLADALEVVYPFLWEEIHIEMNDDMANHLKWTMEDPIFYSMLFAYLLLSLGGLLFFIVGACILGKILAGLFHPQDTENKTLLDDDEGVEDASTKSHHNNEEVIT
uniref:Scavenger receptor class B member 1 n=1 Tax=Amblyomma triste TaxID=251400 RepID=A0A023GDR3_AMBTT